jgi:hypothetical protein
MFDSIVVAVDPDDKLRWRLELNDKRDKRLGKNGIARFRGQVKLTGDSQGGGHRVSQPWPGIHFDLIIMGLRHLY